MNTTGQEHSGVGVAPVAPCGLPRDDATHQEAANGLDGRDAVEEAIADTRPAATIDDLVSRAHQTIGGIRYFVSIGDADKANKLLDRLAKVLTEIRRVGWDSEWDRPRG